MWPPYSALIQRPLRRLSGLTRNVDHCSQFARGVFHFDLFLLIARAFVRPVFGVDLAML